MTKLFQQILADVFPGQDNDALLPRMQILYQMVFEMAAAEEWPRLQAEIITCERMCAENTRLEAERYSRADAETALDMFTGVAYTMASLKLRTGLSQLCADYLRTVFTELLESGVVSERLMDQNRRMISETLVDFTYAAGIADVMSFRIHTLAKR